MKRDYPKQFYVSGLMMISLITGIIFFVSNHLDFIIAAFENTKFNVPNVAYAIIRIFNCLILPTIFIAPSIFPYSRIRITKICYWILAILHLLTITWLIYFFASGYVFENLFSSVAVTFFQQNISNAFVSAQVFWDTYDLISVLFTIILSGIYMAMAITFDDNRKIVRWLYISFVAFKVLVPILYNLIAYQKFLSSFWITNNFIEFLSMAAFAAALWVASSDDETWSTCIWDEPRMKNENDLDM